METADDTEKQHSNIRFKGQQSSYIKHMLQIELSTRCQVCFNIFSSIIALAYTAGPSFHPLTHRILCDNNTQAGCQPDPIVTVNTRLAVSPRGDQLNDWPLVFKHL